VRTGIFSEKIIKLVLKGGEADTLKVGHPFFGWGRWTVKEEVVKAIFYR